MKKLVNVSEVSASTSSSSSLYSHHLILYDTNKWVSFGIDYIEFSSLMTARAPKRRVVITVVRFTRLHVRLSALRSATNRNRRMSNHSDYNIISNLKVRGGKGLV